MLIMDHELWVEKYRPSEMENVISHKTILSTLNKLVETKQIPHLLFYGPPGTGKTSIIFALAKKLNGVDFSSMILELNASDNINMDMIQNVIQDFARTKYIFHTGYKMIILDEVDTLDEASQIELKRLMEKYYANIRFCLICNYIDKIIPSLQSRCTRFRFTSIETKDMKKRLLHVVQKENVNIESKAINAIINISKGDLRKALNLLQSSYLTYTYITAQQIYDLSGLPSPTEITKMYNMILNMSFNVCYHYIWNEIIENGYSLHDIITLMYPKILKKKYTNDKLIYILSKISDVEYYLSFGSTDKIQLSYFIAILKKN